MSESERQAALSRVLEDYAWLVRSVTALLDAAEKSGRDTIRIRQIRGVLEICTPLAADIDAALPPTPGSEPTMPEVSESESAAGEVGL